MQEKTDIKNKYKESLNDATQNIIKKQKEHLKDILKKVKELQIEIKNNQDKYYDGSLDVAYVYEDLLKKFSTTYTLMELLYNYNIESLSSTDKAVLIDEDLLKELKKETNRIARGTAEKTILESMKFHTEISPKECSNCGHLNPPDAKYCNQCTKKL